MEFLKIEDLCKVYGKDENRVVALDHVSLNMEKGDFTAIIGSSGSGKSTLLHAIAGVDMPTGGKIYLDGQDVYAQSNERLAVFRRRQVGLIYQFHNLIPTLNVVENITLPILMDKRKVNRERLKELLELLGLTDRRNHLPNQLSGGQQQRVAIARSLAYHHMRQSAVSTGRLGDPITEITWKAGLSFPDLPHSGKRKNCGL